jgi:hypothetical protein
VTVKTEVADGTHCLELGTGGPDPIHGFAKCAARSDVFVETGREPVFAFVPFVVWQRMGKGCAMTAASWPPLDNYPISDWSDDELIDRYRYVKAEFGGDESDYLDSDANVDVLLKEIILRDLDHLAEAVGDEPATAGREPV